LRRFSDESVFSANSDGALLLFLKMPCHASTCCATVKKVLLHSVKENSSNQTSMGWKVAELALTDWLIFIPIGITSPSIAKPMISKKNCIADLCPAVHIIVQLAGNKTEIRLFSHYLRVT
jgi:hypothetical protein